MIELTDNISKILFKDTKNGYYILTYIDYNAPFTETSLEANIEQIINEFPLMKQHIVDYDSYIYTKDVNGFNIKDHYKIIYDTYTNFDNHIDGLLNSPFETKSKWLFYYLEDTENKKYRFYFKIDHTYADGYKVIEMLMTPLKKVDPTSKLTPPPINLFNQIYYILIGTIVLIMNDIHFFIGLSYSSEPQAIKKETKYLRCKAFKLSEIRAFTRKNNITINDFLYSLMIKTDYLYTGIKRTISSTSPINVSKGKKFNNMVGIFNRTVNYRDNNKLLYDVRELFNFYKYSLYLPIFSFMINNVICILPLTIQSYVYDTLICNCDYVYSNIIGPTHELIDDIHFLINAKHSEIVYNIISSNNNINIICSFKEGTIKDPELFEQSIYKAYDSFIPPTLV